MENRFPEIAAQHTLTSMEVVAGLGAGVAARVRARLKPEVREALEGAVRSDFLPALVDLDVAHAIAAELGAGEARRVAREVLRRSFGGTLLGNLVHSAAALFGLSLPGLLRWAGRGWSRVCRDCGVMRHVETREGLVVLELDGLPEGLDSPVYLEAVAGGLEALFDVCQVGGNASTIARPGGARFELRWWHKAGKGKA